MWGLLDVRHLDASFQTWLFAAAAVTSKHRGQAAEDAATYLGALSLATAEGPTSLNALRFAKSMHVTSVATIKRAMGEGMSLEKASLLARFRSFFSSSRYTLDAQRDVILSATQAAVMPWQRVSAGTADCDFCRMLIRRGPVYTSQSSQFRSHDNCDCLAEPVFGA